MSEVEENRLIAWNLELQKAHDRLRAALRLARQSVDAGDFVSARSDLVLYCRGFCVALSRHHRSEDTGLFPALVREHPQLRDPIAKLTRDHDMIATLLLQFERSITAAGGQDELERHLEGIAAIMESHFRFEERQLLEILRTADLAGDTTDLLGPL